MLKFCKIVGQSIANFNFEPFGYFFSLNDIHKTTLKQ